MVVAGSVVEGTALVVVVASVVVGSTVVVGAVVVGCTVEVGAVVGCTVVVGEVTVERVVVMNVEGAWVVAVPPALAGARADGGVVATGPLRADGTVSGAVVDGRSEVGGSRVVVDADVGAGRVGEVGSATPGVRRGGGG